jgi:hypothetical protein
MASFPFLVIRLWPEQHKDEKTFDEILEALVRHRLACDEVWFATEQAFPTLEEHRASAERMARAAGKTRAAGILPGIQIANTLGHSDRPMYPSEGGTYPPIVGPDGTAAKMCWCPRSPGLHEYVSEMMRAYAAWQPSSVWIDDDLRMQNHSPVRYGCFCEVCLSEFSKESGRAWSRESLVEALNAPDDGTVRVAWTKFGGRGLAALARTIAGTVHEVAPECRMAFQHCGLEWNIYGGTDWDPVFLAMREATGMPVGSRPGHGFYADHRPREVLEKAFVIGRQAAHVPDCVDAITAEVENYPHVAMGKTPHGTVMESSLDLALGCNSLSYAIICWGYEPMSWYEKILERIASYRPFWEEYVAANENTVPGGLEIAFGSNHARRAMLPGEKPFAWAYVSFNEIHQLACIGLPLCVGPKVACGSVLHAKAVPGLSDEELENVLSGGVVTDGAAALLVQERGMGNLLGMRVGEWDRRDCFERFSDNPINGAAKGHSWAAVLRPVRPFIIDEVRSGGHVLGRYEDRNGRKAGIAAAAAENERGGKVAVLGYDAWEHVASGAMRTRLLGAADWVSGGKLPVIIEEPAQVVAVPRVAPDGTLRSVFLLNASIDASPALTLRLRGVSGKNAGWLTPEQAESVIGLRVGPGEAVARVPPMPPWSVGVLIMR